MTSEQVRKRCSFQYVRQSDYYVVWAVVSLDIQLHLIAKSSSYHSKCYLVRAHFIILYLGLFSPVRKHPWVFWYCLSKNYLSLILTIIRTVVLVVFFIKLSEVSETKFCYTLLLVSFVYNREPPCLAIIASIVTLLNSLEFQLLLIEFLFYATETPSATKVMYHLPHYVNCSFLWERCDFLHNTRSRISCLATFFVPFSWGISSLSFQSLMKKATRWYCQLNSVGVSAPVFIFGTFDTGTPCSGFLLRCTFFFSFF